MASQVANYDNPTQDYSRVRVPYPQRTELPIFKELSRRDLRKARHVSMGPGDRVTDVLRLTGGSRHPLGRSPERRALVSKDLTRDDGFAIPPAPIRVVGAKRWARLPRVSRMASPQGEAASLSRTARLSSPQNILRLDRRPRWKASPHSPLRASSGAWLSLREPRDRGSQSTAQLHLRPPEGGWRRRRSQIFRKDRASGVHQKPLPRSGAGQSTRPHVAVKPTIFVAGRRLRGAVFGALVLVSTRDRPLMRTGLSLPHHPESSSGRSFRDGRPTTRREARCTLKDQRQAPLRCRRRGVFIPEARSPSILSR